MTVEHLSAHRDETVDRSQPCVNCGYPLRGLPTGGVCPECGTDVGRSLKGAQLQYAGARYLRRLDSGLSLILSGNVLWLLLAITGELLGWSMLFGSRRGSHETELAVMSGAELLIGSALLLGYWRITTRDPGYADPRAHPTDRLWLRWSATASLVAQCALVSCYSLRAGAIVPPTEVYRLIVLCFVILKYGAYVIQFLSMMHYTRWLASRVPDEVLRIRAGVYAWLLPLIAVVLAMTYYIGPLIALLLYWHLLHGLRAHVKSINTTGEPAQLRGVQA